MAGRYLPCEGRCLMSERPFLAICLGAIGGFEHLLHGSFAFDRFNAPSAHSYFTALATGISRAALARRR